MISTGGARQRRGLGRKLELHAIRHVVFDEEAGVADRRTLGIGVGAHAPGAGRDARVEREAQAAAADALVRRGDAAILETIRPLDHQNERRAGRGDALAVAQQRRDLHRLTGAIDAALGVNERIEPIRAPYGP